MAKCDFTGHSCQNCDKSDNRFISKGNQNIWGFTENKGHFFSFLLLLEISFKQAYFKALLKTPEASLE